LYFVQSTQAIDRAQRKRIINITTNVCNDKYRTWYFFAGTLGFATGGGGRGAEGAEGAEGAAAAATTIATWIKEIQSNADATKSKDNGDEKIF
jgi:hypothetical protein